jgi:ribonuclease J
VTFHDPGAPTRVLFFGGMGEVGRNMMAVESGGSILVLECGLSFPTDEMLGVDLVLPDWTYLTERADSCVGVVLSHGHEDHVGALTWFLRDVDVPVYGTPLTLGIARRRLDEFGVEAQFVDVLAPGEAHIGPFLCRFFAVAHSIPDCLAVAVETKDGMILYTGDFKLDATPIDGRSTDVEGLAALGAAGVDLMLADSTNAERPGRTPSEALVGEELRKIFNEADGRIVVACFASNLHRIQQVCELAQEVGRKVFFVGRSMVANVEVGLELGHLHVAPETICDIGDLGQWPPEKTAVVCTGSQGEPLSALTRISSGEHKLVKVQQGDTVILSASPIPGNEPAVHRILNGLYKAGADVFHSETSAVHVSGHAAAEELAEMAAIVKPRHLVPVHGEFRHLALHARIAVDAGIDESHIWLAEDGAVLELLDGDVRRAEPIDVGMVFVDGLGVGDVGPVVLRDRRVLSKDGILICVLTIDAQNGEILAGPDLISRGFVYEDESRDFLNEAADRVLAALHELETDHVTEWSTIKKECRHALGEFAWRQTRRRPMILPIIMEV